MSLLKRIVRIPRDRMQSFLRGADGNAMHEILKSLQDRISALESGLNSSLSGTAAATASHRSGQDHVGFPSEKYNDPNNLPEALLFLNSLAPVYNAHLNDDNSHSTLDASNAITAAFPATDLATAQALANDIKSVYNAHRSQVGVHDNDDAGNDITAADASDLSTLLTLCAEIRLDYNGHLDNVVGINKALALNDDRIID